MVAKIRLLTSAATFLESVLQGNRHHLTLDF